jgi:hypothetical protein
MLVCVILCVAAFPNINIDAKGTSLKFDRILADVP